jgi:uncharacterized protein (TIGR02145 family)
VAGAVGNTDFSEYRNKSGFSAVPNGYRAFQGSFYGDGIYAYWWGTTENNALAGCGRGLHWNNDTVRVDYFNERYGFSVRCVKD